MLLELAPGEVKCCEPESQGEGSRMDASFLLRVEVFILIKGAQTMKCKL